jgi:Holliday junction resolvase RusA-like endonuclease
MSKIHLVVKGDPVGKGRPRRGRNRVMYTPKETVNQEVLIKTIFNIEYPDHEPIYGACRMRVTAYLSIPASASKKMKMLMVDDVIEPTKRPDLDNLLKIVMDALEGRVYKNDSQVTRVTLIKGYSTQPRMEIEVEWK